MNINLSRIVILAGDAGLAEQLCSKLRKRGIYLPLFEEPMIRLVEYGVFANECIQVGNAIRALKPQHFLCLKVRPEVLAEFQRYFKDLRFTVIENCDAQFFKDTCESKSNCIYAKDLQYIAGGSAEDIFVVEGDSGFSSVIAANLAAAHGGRILHIDSVSDDEVDLIKEESRVWANGTPGEQRQAKIAIESLLKERLPRHLLEGRNQKSISFITKGLPYGILPFDCPVTHFFSFPHLGLNIISGMLKSGDDFRCPIAILIDPALVQRSEFSTLQDTLGKAGYYLRNAYGENASAKFATYLTEHLPSDFIFYSTHCGEVKGQRVTEQFADRQGASHIICYDRALSIFRSPNEVLFEVKEIHSWVSIDGVSWDDDAGKIKLHAGELLKTFLEHLKQTKHEPEKRNFISVTKCGIIRGSDALGMSDTNFFPTPQTVGCYHHPVVFNNACSSWRGLAMTYGCGGASVYIGTSALILDSFAILGATRFAAEVASGKAIGPALFRAQRKITQELGYSPYLMHGYLYTRLRNPTRDRRFSRVQQRIIRALKLSLQQPSSRRESAVVAFLEDELRGFSITASTTQKP